MDGILPWESCFEQSEQVSALFHCLIYTAGALDLSVQTNLHHTNPKLLYILPHHLVQYFHLFPCLLCHSTSVLSSPAYFFYLPLASQKEYIIVQ